MVSFEFSSRGKKLSAQPAKCTHRGGGEEEEEEDLFVFNDTIEGDGHVDAGLNPKL